MVDTIMEDNYVYSNKNYDDRVWYVHPYKGDMNQYVDPVRGMTRNVIAIFHREVDAKAHTQLLNK